MLLTRRRNFGADATGEVFVLSSDLVSDQLTQVTSSFGPAHGFLPRCTMCNSELTLVSRAEVDVRVPEFVYKSQSEFAFCPQCDKYYWKGTHWENATRIALAAQAPGQERRQS